MGLVDRARALGVCLVAVAGLALGCSSKDELGAGSGGHGAGTTTGTGAQGAGASGAGSPGDCGTPEPEHLGEATYYDFADGSGACSFDATPNDLLVGAMNAPDYAGAAVCGACAAIDGPDGSVTVRIVDLCPGCASGDIDLSPEAFALIAPLAAGRVDIGWRFVACDVTGPVAYHFKEGSNQWWTAVQIRNHRYAVQSLEYRDGHGDFVPVARESYDFFVEPAGMGTGPYTFRVTDVKSHALEDGSIPHVEAGTVDGSAQFPACP